MRAALLVATVTAIPTAAPLRRAGHGRGRGRLPADRIGRDEAHPRRAPDARAGADADILAEVGRIVRGEDTTGDIARQAHVPAPVLVGFAAETGSLERAPQKLRRKGVDLLVANDVAEAGSGLAIRN